MRQDGSVPEHPFPLPAAIAVTAAGIAAMVFGSVGLALRLGPRPAGADRARHAARSPCPAVAAAAAPPRLVAGRARRPAHRGRHGRPLAAARSRALGGQRGPHGSAVAGVAAAARVPRRLPRHPPGPRAERPAGRPRLGAGDRRAAGRVRGAGHPRRLPAFARPLARRAAAAPGSRSWSRPCSSRRSTSTASASCSPSCSASSSGSCGCARPPCGPRSSPTPA